jgi:hypothetical protein
LGGIGGILTGALALAALQTVVSSDRATSGLASLVQVPGKWARTFMDPSKALLPNYAGAKCAEGDVSLFSALTAAYEGQAGGAVAAQPVSSIPNPSTLPPTTGGGSTSPPKVVQA